MVLPIQINSLFYVLLLFLRYPHSGRDHDRNMLVISNMEYKYVLSKYIRQGSIYVTK